MMKYILILGEIINYMSAIHLPGRLVWEELILRIALPKGQYDKILPSLYQIPNIPYLIWNSRSI